MSGFCGSSLSAFLTAVRIAMEAHEADFGRVDCVSELLHAVHAGTKHMLDRNWAEM